MGTDEGIRELVIATDHDFANYSMLLGKAQEAMVYHTKEYVDFVASYLQAEAYYLALKKGDRLLAAIPIVLKKNSKLGNIINSNPYYGSNGGIIVNPDLPPIEKNRIKARLLDFLASFSKNHDCILSTIIASSLDRDQMFYRQYMHFEYLDRRVGQVTVIPPAIIFLFNSA